MAKVYIANKGAHDYSAAERYGEIIFLSKGLQNRYNVGESFRSLYEGLSDFKEEDYLLVTGLQLMNILCAAVIARRYKNLNLLIFKDGQYLERNIDLDALSDDY